MGWSSEVRGALRRRRGIYCVLAGLAAMAIFAASRGAGADEKPQSHPAPGFDYWQPEWMVRELWGPGRMPKGMMVRLLRHTTFVHTGVPQEYEGARSTVETVPEAIGKGRAAYDAHCARCHGANGMGNGDAANALTPSPALLAFMIRKPISVDEYLLWTISDGGKQFDSAMPAFRDTLSRDEIWAVIAYMRAGFPREAAKPGEKR